jgi:hypothetical protein
MSKKYSIICNEDNSFNIENDGSNKVNTEVKDMVSFCLQYLYTVLNSSEITLSESAKQKVIDVINSFEFDKDDIKQLSLLIVKIGEKLNKSMMTYDNGIPKLWEDEV